MAAIPLITSIGFVLTTLATLYFFYQATKSKSFLIGILIYMAIVGIVGYTGFYRVENTIPPRFIFLLAPGVLALVLLFLSQKGRTFSDQTNLRWLTLLHVIRVPVELVLFSVFQAGLIPELMTFEGYNYDILSGISAPLIYYAVFVKKWIGNKGLLLWNVLCLGLLINILTIAILSAKTPIQQLAFDQPNVGVTYFPFVWLPAVVVPIVFYAHLASIRQLTKK